MKILMKAPASIRKMWEEYGKKFRSGDIGPNPENRAYYSPADDAVFLSIDRVAAGGNIDTRYSTLFHEYGHMTDYLIARDKRNMRYTAYSELYENGLLGKTAKAELQGHLGRIQAMFPTYTSDEAAKHLAWEARSRFSLRDRSDISDMMEGAGIGIGYPLGVGHGLEYWENRDSGGEIFAEITSAMAANSGSLKAIKEYFPQTFEVYQKMIKDRGKWR